MNLKHVKPITEPWGTPWVSTNRRLVVCRMWKDVLPRKPQLMVNNSDSDSESMENKVKKVWVASVWAHFETCLHLYGDKVVSFSCLRLSDCFLFKWFVYLKKWDRFPSPRRNYAYSYSFLDSIRRTQNHQIWGFLIFFLLYLWSQSKVKLEKSIRNNEI